MTLGSERVGRDAGQIAAEVVSHLEGLVKAKVTVTLEIEAEIPEGAPENVVRTVTENARTLKFSSHGFEQEQVQGSLREMLRHRWQEVKISIDCEMTTAKIPKTPEPFQDFRQLIEVNQTVGNLRTRTH